MSDNKLYVQGCLKSSWKNKVERDNSSCDKQYENRYGYYDGNLLNDLE